MFTYLNKQGVKSIKGFIVQRTGRFTAQYQEGIKKITVDLEDGGSSGRKFFEIISSNAFIKWDGGMPIAPEKQSEILQNFKEAMEFQGIGIIVDKD